MRRKVLLTIVCFLFVTGGLADDNSRGGANSEKPLMFFVQNKSVSDNSITAQFKKFADIAREVGFCVDQATWTEINDDLVEDKDVLVFMLMGVFLNDEDKKALRRYIRGGGKVLFICQVGPDPVDYTNLASFTREFGVDFGATSFSNEYGYVVEGTPLSSPETVKKLRSPMARINLLVDKTRAQVQARLDNGYNLCAISTRTKSLGRGKLIVHGDILCFYYIPMFPGIEYEDNTEFAKNVCVYLFGESGGCDLKMASARLKGKKNLKAIAKIRNIGTSDSKRFKLQFVLSDDGTIDPAGTVTILKTLTISNPIISGTQRKITTKVKIPGWVTPGKYYLVVVADPDDTAGDSDLSNNTKVSKAYTVK